MDNYSQNLIVILEHLIVILESTEQLKGTLHPKNSIFASVGAISNGTIAPVLAVSILFSLK